MRGRWVGPAAGYVGAVVGAGFASGREIQHFFAAHGAQGLAGAMLAGALFAFVGATVLRRVARDGIRHYGELLRGLCGPALGTALDRLGTFAIAAGLVVVLAGGGALGTMMGGWPRMVGVVGLAVLLVATEAMGRRAHAAVNLAVVPLIAATCVFAAAHPVAPLGHLAPTSPRLPWGLASVLYVAYNLMLGVAGLCVAAEPGLTPREAALGGVAGGAVLGALCAAIAWVLLSGAGARAELPLGAVLGPGPWRSLGYPLTLLLALWTTGAATVRALTDRVATGRRWAGALAVLLALPFAGLGLVGLVAIVYPLLGFIGLPLLAAVAIAATAPVRSAPR